MLFHLSFVEKSYYPATENYLIIADSIEEAFEKFWKEYDANSENNPILYELGDIYPEDPIRDLKNYVREENSYQFGTIAINALDTGSKSVFCLGGSCGG